MTILHHGIKRDMIGRREIIVSPRGSIRFFMTAPRQTFSLSQHTRKRFRLGFTERKTGLDARVKTWLKQGYSILYDCTGVYGDLPPWQAEPVEQEFHVNCPWQAEADKPQHRER